MRKLLLLIIILTTETAYSQCSDSDKIGISGEFGGHDYITFCPTYNFSFDGDTSKQWNKLNDPIDIHQVPFLIEIKNRLESKIRDYAGDSFFSYLKFYSAEISYPDSISKFEDRRPECKIEKCKAKYFFYYYFVPVDNVKYCIGIALNDREEIVSDLKIPSKKDYRPVDNTVTICKIIEIARQTNKQIDPIDKISFDYDYAEKRYHWTISQRIVNAKEGENEFNQVIIDASDIGKTKRTKGKAFIVY